jgi:hypothetical protein
MKNKTIIILSILVVSTFIFGFVTKSAETTKKYLSVVVLRTGLKVGTKMMIIPEVGPPDDPIDMDGGVFDGAAISNAVALNTAFNKLGDKGYKLVATTCDNFSGTSGVTQYFFEKE